MFIVISNDVKLKNYVILKIRFKTFSFNCIILNLLIKILFFLSRMIKRVDSDFLIFWFLKKQ
jgi:hypothetical protein